MKKRFIPIMLVTVLLGAVTTGTAFAAADLMVYSAGPKSLSTAVVAKFQEKTGLKEQL